MDWCTRAVQVPPEASPPRMVEGGGGASRAPQTQISWTNFDQNHVYFVLDIFSSTPGSARKLWENVFDRQRVLLTAFLVHNGLNDVF